MDDFSREVGTLSGRFQSRRRVAPASSLGLLRPGRRSAAHRARAAVTSMQRAGTRAQSLNASPRMPPNQRDCAGLVGLHHARPRPDRRGRAARPARSCSGCRGQASRWCSTTRSRSSTSRKRSNTSTPGGRAPRQPGRHLRADRTDRTAAAGGAARQRARPRRALRAFLGHGRMVRRRHRHGSAGHASAQLRARRP